MEDSPSEIPAVVKTTPKSEYQEVEIQVASGETLKVKYTLLMLSPVIRAAAITHTSSSGQVPDKIDIKLDCNLSAAKWFFGILEGREFEDMLNEIIRQDQSTLPILDDLRQALRLADFYGIPCFSRLLVEIGFSLGNTPGGYPLMAFAIGVDLGHLRLARFALNRMDSQIAPIKFNKLTAQALGIDTWWCLVHAYGTAFSTSSKWIGRSTKWNDMARAIVLDDAEVTR